MMKLNTQLYFISCSGTGSKPTFVLVTQILNLVSAVAPQLLQHHQPRLLRLHLLRLHLLQHHQLDAHLENSPLTSLLLLMIIQMKFLGPSKVLTELAKEVTPLLQHSKHTAKHYVWTHQFVKSLQLVMRTVMEFFIIMVEH